MIERLSKAMSVALVGNRFTRNPSKISFEMRSKVCSYGLKLEHYKLSDF